MNLRPMLSREVHIGQHVVLGLVHEAGKFRQLGSELIGDPAPLRPGGLGALLGEGGGHEG